MKKIIVTFAQWLPTYEIMADFAFGEFVSTDEQEIWESRKMDDDDIEDNAGFLASHLVKWGVKFTMEVVNA